MSNESFIGLVDTVRKDIWRYAKLLDAVTLDSQIKCKQADFTPIEGMGDSALWLKREDQSITGSHKFRSLQYQLSRLLDTGTEKAVLSSSGNAAISASKLLPKNANLKLFVFLSKKTPVGKLAALEFSENFIPILSDRPLRMAKYAIKHFGLKDLRPSQDSHAVIGFRSLGFEIFEQKAEIENIFSFATSFASIRGIAEAYQALKDLGAIEKLPRIFAVNATGKLAGELSRQANLSSGQKELSTGQRACLPAGRWTPVDISDEEILAAKNKYPQLQTSLEGIASLAAAEKTKAKGESLIVLTGRNWEGEKVDFEKFEIADNFAEVDKITARYK
ncbi:pyridoxal-phosphate dependent enzyme [Candidatus Gracilibacteria bacterium]|nr:pyridoxal-phosphate dependent enzyme [Candidatus Gracilibacteria bacterium]MCF7856761.1 pyridoxal-phosphate dependent enzyme [Candidatus Gracilibacteria bacterium]MCF7897057.1 pyridoxal-phosphate dependent enzyme [Candidatus Gracilibacteria bacterium]